MLQERQKGFQKLATPGESNRKYLVQRSNAGYDGQNNVLLGKSIVAYNSKTNAFMLVVQENGRVGLDLTGIRDYLSGKGYDNAISFDGSDSATLIKDGDIMVAPNEYKDNAIPSGVNFQLLPDKPNK